MIETWPKPAPFTDVNKQNFAFSVPKNQYVNDSNFNPKAKAAWRTKCWHQGMCLMAKKQKQCSANETPKYQFDITGINDFLCIDV